MLFEVKWSLSADSIWSLVPLQSTQATKKIKVGLFPQRKKFQLGAFICELFSSFARNHLRKAIGMFFPVLFWSIDFYDKKQPFHLIYLTYSSNHMASMPFNRRAARVSDAARRTVTPETNLSLPILQKLSLSLWREVT